MKRITVVLLALSLALAGCGKQPTEDLHLSKAAIDAAVGEGAEKYIAEDLQAVNDKLTAAMEEITIQDGKLFKDYDRAKQMLADVKAEAESLKVKVATVKEQLKADADSALTAAGSAVAVAAGQLEFAPQGKGSMADVAMLKADVQGLQGALAEIQPLIDAGEYTSAIERATAIGEKAAAISAEVAAAQEQIAQARINK